MMNLKMVTWDGDLTQFLVEADTNLEAIRKAVKANLQIGDCDEEIEDDIHDLTTYTVEDVDFSLLMEIFQRTDLIGPYRETVVFNKIKLAFDEGRQCNGKAQRKIFWQ